VGQCRTFRYRLYLTFKQTARLEQLLGFQCELYNAALEERRGAWKWERRPIRFFDQCRTLTELRSVRPEVLACGVTVCRGTLKRLDLAFCAFYRRCRKGQVPGSPRVKSRVLFNPPQWEDTHGWKLKADARRLRLQGIGEVKVHLHREMRGTPKAITVKREGRHWWVSFRCVDVPANPLPATGRAVGVDLGVVNLIATSDGLTVDGARLGRMAQFRLTQAQRDLATKRRGSKHRRRAVERVALHHRRVRNQRRDLAHKVSRGLVNDYDLIVLEDLAITSMVRRPKPRPCSDGSFEPNGASAKAGLNRSIQDAGWGELARQSRRHWSRARVSQPQVHLAEMCRMWARRREEPAKPGGVLLRCVWASCPRRRERRPEHLVGRQGPAGARQRRVNLTHYPTRGRVTAPTDPARSVPRLVVPGH
jgi:putative transposase